MSLTLVMTVLVGLLVGSIVMLSFNHYFYLRKRLADLRLESVNEVNWLLAQFLTNRISDSDYVPGREFLHEFRAATSKAAALFSGATWQVFKRVEAMIEPNAKALPEGKRDIDAFLEAQDAALRAFYREAGLRVPRG